MFEESAVDLLGHQNASNAHGHNMQEPPLLPKASLSPTVKGRDEITKERRYGKRS